MRGSLVLVTALVMVAACSPHPAPTPTFAPTPTPVPGPTLSPTGAPPGAGLGDCDGIPRSSCEAAWAAAVGPTLDPKLLPRIVGWQVRPTIVRMCGGGLVPKFDVTLHLDTGTDVTVTVAQHPGGRLEACTY